MSDKEIKRSAKAEAKRRRKRRKAKRRRRLEAEQARKKRNVVVAVLVAALAVLVAGGTWAWLRSDESGPPPNETLARMQAEEDAQLSSYAWIDAEKGTVQIPIERAMQIIARRGLPARRTGPKAKSPTSRPSESGLGIQKRKRRGGRR